MDFFADNILLVSLLPLWIFFIILSSVFFKITENNKITFLITCLASITGLIFSISSLNYINTSNKVIIEKQFEWLSSGDIHICIGTSVNSLTTVFLSVIFLLSLFLQIYSYGYMKNKKQFNVMFMNFNFFNFAISAMILSPNIIQYYIFQVLTIISLYVFHCLSVKRKGNTSSFIITNSLCDMFLFIGIIILTYFSVFYLNKTSNELLSFYDFDLLKEQLYSLTSSTIYNIILFLFILFCLTKTIQAPFNHNLKDDTEYNTPAITLVASVYAILTGIIFFIKIQPLLTEELIRITLVIGLLSSVLFAYMSVLQTSLSKKLLYMLTSQVGFIYILLSLNALSTVIIYCTIITFVYSLLFLCSGIIINNYNTDNVEKISGIKKYDYLLSIYWLIGAISLSGLFLGGFTIKEALINTVKQNNISFILLLILISYYFITYSIFSCYFRMFEGNTEIKYNKAEPSMIISIRALCLFVIFPGFLFNISKLNILSLITTFILIFAILHAYFDYKRNKQPRIHKLFTNWLYIPLLYKFAEKIIHPICEAIRNFDNYFLDYPINRLLKTNQNNKFSAENSLSKNLIFTLLFLALMFVIAILLYKLFIRGING